MTTVGLLYSRLRAEENLLIEAAKSLGVAVTPMWDEQVVLDLDGGGLQGDVLLARSVSGTRGLYVLRAARAAGLPAVNDYDTSAACMDKTETSLRLRRAGIPTPDVRIAFGRQAALDALDAFGYPAVLKPTLGSWARLIAKVDDREDAEQILEHREALPNPLQHVYYMQRYVAKGNGSALHRDMRAFVIGDETVAAVWRTSAHWITNTARGGKTENCPITPELNELCLKAAASVGGGVLALDLMEGPDGLLVHEINHTMEFRNSIQPTGVNIPERVIQYAVAEARQ
jgi:[lysine-biosynthesis-protein LysW]---L-2-aminoadipate ligase